MSFLLLTLNKPDHAWRLDGMLSQEPHVSLSEQLLGRVGQELEGSAGFLQEFTNLTRIGKFCTGRQKSGSICGRSHNVEWKGREMGKESHPQILILCILLFPCANEAIAVGAEWMGLGLLLWSSLLWFLPCALQGEEWVAVIRLQQTFKYCTE